MTYAQTHDFDRSIDQLQSASELSGVHPGALSALAYVLGAAGRHSEGREVLAKLVGLQQHRHVLAYFVAFAMSSLSSKDETLEWLENAYEERSGWPLYLHFEPAFDPLRSDPQFASLLKRINPLKPRSGAQMPSKSPGKPSERRVCGVNLSTPAPFR